MKKLVALVLATVMALSMVACGGNGAAKVEITDAKEVLTKTWTEYLASASADLQFPIAGGDMANANFEGPEKFDLTQTDELSFSYCIPTETIAMVDDAATAMNMMMANNFSAASYHVTDAANTATVVSNIKDATMNNQWMCGFPEKLIIVTIGDSYVVSAFGNGQVIDAFKTAITTVYGDAAVVSVEESLAE